MPWLWVFPPGAGPGEGQAVALPPGGLRLGREGDNDLVLEDGGTSRHHARIQAEAGGWIIEDLGSANGTWIGDLRVQRQRVAAGVYFRLGETRLVIVDEAAPATEQGAGPATEPAAGPARVGREVSGLAPAPAARRKGRLGLALLAATALGFAAALALAGGLVAESRDPRLLPSQLASLVRNGWSGRLRPAPLPVSGTAALDARPHAALRLRAPAGALDRPRSFTAAPLDGPALDQASRVLHGMLPVAGFELDGGMAEDDCFAGKVRMEWDLERLGVPAEARSRVQLVRQAPDGRIQFLQTRLEGSRAVAELRHNGVFFAVFLGFAGWEVITLIKDQVDQGTFDRNVSDSAGPFRLFWPRRLALANTTEYRLVEAAMKARWDAAMSLPMEGGDRQVWTGRYYRYLADPEVQRLRKVMEDPAWKRAHYYPPAVANSLDAFDRAYEYLHATRGFLKRSDQIEIHFLDPWNGTPGDYAYTLDGAYTYPYIHVNLALVPAARQTTAAPSKQMDDLHTTAVHELFHVVQKEYFNWTKYLNWTHFRGGGKFVWFSEATALLLEEEAEPHYLARGWVKTFHKTFDPGKFMGLYKLPLDAQGRDQEETRHKGYAASRFLLSLRDRYYAANREAFLKALMEAFGTFRTGAVDALKQVTSQSDKVLGADYLLFCAKEGWPIYNNTPVPLAGDLSAQAPRRGWKDTGPLSSPCVELRWRSVPAADLKGAMVMVRTGKGEDRGVWHRWGWNRGAATDWRNISGACLVAAVAGSGHHAPGLAGLGVQRVEAYTASPWFARSGDATTALLLLPPKAPPRIRMNPDKKSLRIEVPETPLWRLGESSEIRVRFHGSLSGGRPLPISLGPGNLSADIDLAQILGTQEGAREAGGLLRKAMEVVSLQDIQDMLAISEFMRGATGEASELRVSYSEVVKTDPEDPEDRGVEGPESPVFKVPAEAQPGVAAFDINGAWKGQVLFLHKPVTFRNGLPGQILMETEVLPFRAGGSAQHGGTELNILERVGAEYRPTGVSVYVYRLPGRKLWLTVPPTVLYPEGGPPVEAPGWWDALFGSRGKP